MAVVKEYEYENATVRIHDDYLLKDKKEIDKVLEEVAKIYVRAFERKLEEGAGWMKFNMDKAMRNLGYAVMLLGTCSIYAFIFVQMIGRLCKWII